MKIRKIAIISLSLALTGTLTALATACDDPSATQQPDREYTFQDGRPDGDLAAPDAGFKIDGVLDETAYASLDWLEGPVLRPYYTDDGQGVYYDYDVIQQKSQEAAQVKMGTYYGENGVYIAYSYKEQAGKFCYVNPARKAYRNSGVELHIGVPASGTMTGDETVSRITVNANGALTVAKTQGDLWMPLYGTEDPLNMPYVGLTGNGTRTDANADRTEYTFELFIPWGYFDEVGGEGTAKSMQEGGDLVVAPGIVTANNYTGTGQTDREYYVLSARLDNGQWANAQGWYHFNENGVVGYDITVKEAQNGAVQEWMGYDTAAKNSSVTFVTKANDGYALKEFRVNGKAVPRDYIRYDMYDTLGAKKDKSAQKAYVRIPQKEVTGNIEVEAVFEPLAAGEQALKTTVYGAGVETPLAGRTLTFTRGETVKSGTTDENGVLTIEGLTAGLYYVTVDDLAYRSIRDYVFYSTGANAALTLDTNALPLEGSENIASNYREICGEIDSLKNGFVFSGFFGFEGVSYDELTNFTNTVYFVSNGANDEKYGFRFTKWGSYLMLKYEGAEYHFEGDQDAVDYFKTQKGVHFKFAVNAEGEISAYIRRNDTDWVQLSTNSNVSFPVDKTIEKIEFGKQDDFNTHCYATLTGGTLTIGVSRPDLPVSVTVNGEAPVEESVSVTGGTIKVPSGIMLSDRVTVTLAADAGYALKSLTMNGSPVSFTTNGDGTYSYTFTATAQAYAFVPVFEKAQGDLSVVLDIKDGIAQKSDLTATITLAGSDRAIALDEAANGWAKSALSFGRYLVTVTSKSGGYAVYSKAVYFDEENTAFTVTVNADNYGANRKYTLEGESATEDGVVLAENLGATTNGFVFEGFLGVGGSGSLADIGTKNYATALRFTTESGYQFRLCFYIWNGQYWLVKAFQEGQENQSGLSNEFAFTGNTVLIDYVKAQNGITVSIAAAADGTLTVYAKTSDTEWVSLGTWQSPFEIDEKITQVEVLRMFQQGIEGWTATVDGELKFGTAEADLPVTVTVNGGAQIVGGTVDVTESTMIGDEITLTFTPAGGYELSDVTVDGKGISWTQGDGVYTYTFTATKSSYSVEVLFGELHDLVITADMTAVPAAANDLSVTLTNAAGEVVSLTNESNVWTAQNIPYGSYTIIVTSVSGSYTVLEQEVTFEEDSESVTLTVTADNYGANRKYVLNGESATENGVVLAENLGATTDGFVFEGFLGVGGSGSLADIGTKNYATALRFTTESGYQYRVCFYIWAGQYWLIKVFEEDKENSAQSHEFGFSGNTALINYVKEKNGITVNIGVDNEGNFSVYAMTSATEWISLGSWKMTEYEHGKIEKVELLRMFQSGIEGWTAVVDGELRFGTTDTEIKVSFTGTGSVTGGSIEVTDASLGGEVTVTLTPDEGYVFSSLSVDGEPVECTSGADGVYTYTFTATKSSYVLTATFGELHDLTVTVDTSAMPDAAEDIDVTLADAAGGEIALQESGGTLTAQIPYGSYTIIVTSVSGGYTVLTKEVTFAEGSESVTLTVTADNYGANRKYELQGENDEEYSGGVLAENIGSTESFVFKGFLGITSGSDSLDALKESQNGSFGAGLRFIMSDGTSFRIAFVANNGTWSIRCYWQEAGNAEHDNVTLTMNETLKSYVSENGGVNIIVVAEMVGGTPVVTIYIESAENTWQQLGTYTNSNIPLNKTIAQVTVAKMWISDNPKRTPYVEGTLSFGTTDTGIDVTFTGTGEVTGGKVETTSSNIGDEVTVTLTPEEGYVFSSLSVDGEPVECTSGADGVYTYTFTATKSSYAFTAVFKQVGGAYTVNVTIGEGLNAADDLSIVLSNGSSEYAAIKGEGNVWTTESIPYGTYTIIVTSVSGGYTVLEQEVNFEEGSNSVTVNITADNYGANRKYTLEGESATEDGVVLAENLGATTNGFVFEGFLGVGGSGSLADIGTKNYATALRFTTESGYQFRLCFYIWNGQYWLVKAFQEGQENQSGLSNEFAFTGNTVLIDYVKAQNGITVSIAAAADGTLTVYAKTSDTEWVSLGTWQSPFEIDEKITQVEVLRMFQTGIEGWTAVVDGELRFGTTDTGLPAVSVLTETIDLDEKGTKYWEHYSSGTGANNAPTVTDGKANATDIIVFDPSGWDRYETRPYNADNAQAFTGTNQNGELNSNGFVFRDQSNALTATITLSKGDTAVKVYTGTWISNCQFTISLTDADGNVVGSIEFTVTNGSATYETIFFIDTSDWAEDESRQFTLTCGSNNTLKLMAIAIS